MTSSKPRGRRIFAVGIAIITMLIALSTGAGSAIAAADSEPGTLATQASSDGPFAVGTATDTFVDTTRPTPPNGSYPGSPVRTIKTTVYYPAGGPPGPGDHHDATPAKGQFPLLIFAHGNSSSGPYNRPLVRRWAAAGFVVAAPTFPLTNIDAPGGDDIGDYIHQPGDISFVITQMLHPSSKFDEPWRRSIESNSIGVVGHSLGAITVLGAVFNSCCRDPRIKAAVSIDGLDLPFPDGVYFTGPPRPLLVIHGTADQTIPYSAGQQTYEDASPPKYFLTLIGAPHTSFHQTNDPNSPRKPWQPVIVSTVTDFFDHYLKDQPTLSQLKTDAQVPGVSTLSYERR